MDETTKPKPKRNKKQRSVTRQLRDTAVINLALEGTKNQKEIAGAAGVHRTTVARILSSEEVKAILKQSKSRANQMLEMALDTIENALTSRNVDMTNGLKAALAIAKTFGVITDKMDLSHSFPKPTIIEKRNGDQVILGAAYDDDESAA